MVTTTAARHAKPRRRRDEDVLLLLEKTEIHPNTHHVIRLRLDVVSS